jgi:replicative DNA helicase
MSAGLSLIKKLCTQGSRTAFRRTNPNHFIIEERPVFDYVNTYVRQYGQLPTLEALNDNSFPLQHIRDNETADYYLQRMADRFIVLQSRDIMAPLQQAVVQGNAQVILDIVTSLAGTLRTTITGGAVVSLAEVIDQVVERYEVARTSPGIQGFTMGYEWLDEMTGGLQAGDVCSIAARTGMGKSYYLNHMSMGAWLAGCSCLYVSMEMTALQMVTRFIGQYTGINPENIRRGQLSHWTQDRFYAETAEMRTGAPFTIVDGSFRLGPDDIDNLVQEFNPDVVYVDAAYLLIPKEIRKTEQGWERQREMSKDIKRIALSRNKPVVQTLQLNSDARKKKRDDLDSGMIGGSIGISQDSTTVIILTEGESPREHDTRDLLVDKNREGRKGWMRANFLFEPMDFSYLTCSDDETDEVRQTQGFGV